MFVVEEQQFAICLDQVKQVVQMVEVTPLPMAPEHVHGLINYHGTIIPVIDIRNLFHLGNRDVKLSDQLIIVQTETMLMALWADSMFEAVTLLDPKIFEKEKVYLEFDAVAGIIKLNNNMVLLTDLEKLLSKEQLINLTEAIQKQAG